MYVNSNKCCGESVASTQVSAWESLNAEFGRTNEEFEKVIVMLFEKLNPITDNRPTPPENPTCDKSPERQYNSQMFQEFHQRLIAERALVRRLREFVDVLEV